MKHFRHDARLCGHHAGVLHDLIWAVTQNCQEPALGYSVTRAQAVGGWGGGSTSHCLDKICLGMELVGAEGWQRGGHVCKRAKSRGGSLLGMVTWSSVTEIRG